MNLLSPVERKKCYRKEKDEKTYNQCHEVGSREGSTEVDFVLFALFSDGPHAICQQSRMRVPQ